MNSSPWIARYWFPDLLPDVAQIVQNRAELHRAVMRLFDLHQVDRSARASVGALCWADCDENGAVLWVRSTEAPDARRLLGGRWSDEWRVAVQVDSEFARISEGATGWFRLFAHPIKRISRSREHVALNDAESAVWVERKLAAAGLRLISLCRVGKAVPLAVDYGPGGRHFQVAAREFTGNLVVDDADKARAAYVHGIGRLKNYGCGMLQVSFDGGL